METEWTSVKSNNVAAYRYDGDGKVLEAKFHSAPDTVYRYEGVEPEVVQSVFVAPDGWSVGRAFSKLVWGRYLTTKREV